MNNDDEQFCLMSHLHNVKPHEEREEGVAMDVQGVHPLHLLLHGMRPVLQQATVCYPPATRVAMLSCHNTPKMHPHTYVAFVSFGRQRAALPKELAWRSHRFAVAAAYALLILVLNFVTPPPVVPQYQRGHYPKPILLQHLAPLHRPRPKSVRLQQHLK